MNFKKNMHYTNMCPIFVFVLLDLEWTWTMMVKVFNLLMNMD
jgi:hypothetical protein